MLPHHAQARCVLLPPQTATASNARSDVVPGRPEVQSFVGSLVGLNATKGVMVTTSTFTSQAIEYVKSLPQRVILIDGKTLAALMIEHNVGVRASRSIDLKRVDDDFFSEED